MKILISGYYGFGNLGDESLLAGLLPALKSHELTILSAKPKETQELHKVKSVHRYYAALFAILNTDVLISGGGGLLQNKSSNRSLQYYLWVIKLAKLFNKKVIIFAQSIGPIDEYGKKLLVNALKDCKIAVRDKKSQDLLSSLAFNTELVADPALLLKAPSNKREGVLIFPRAGYPDISDAIINMGKSLKAKGFKIKLAAIHASVDEAEIKRIQKEIKDIEYISTKTPEDLLELISKSEYVISARLHGAILAAVAKTEYCGIVYDPKVAAFLDEADAAKFELPVNYLGLIRLVLEPKPINHDSFKQLQARAQNGLEWLLKEIEA